MNCERQMKWLWKTNIDRSFITLQQSEEIMMFKQTNINQVHKQVDATNEQIEQCNIGFTGHIHRNGVIRILFQQEEAETNTDSDNKKEWSYNSDND